MRQQRACVSATGWVRWDWDDFGLNALADTPEGVEQFFFENWGTEPGAAHHIWNPAMAKDPEAREMIVRWLGAAASPAAAVSALRSAHQIDVTDLLESVCRLDDQLKESHRRIRTAVVAADTSVTDVFGIGPIIAAMLIGYTGDIARFTNRDAYAAYNGTAPIEYASGGRSRHRLSRRGNRHLNHALHLAALCQIRQPHSTGRAYFDRKLEEGKTKKEALRALKRQISNTVYRHLLADNRR